MFGRIPNILKITHIIPIIIGIKISRNPDFEFLKKLLFFLASLMGNFLSTLFDGKYIWKSSVFLRDLDWAFGVIDNTERGIMYSVIVKRKIPVITTK